MNRDKQIEEIARDICARFDNGICHLDGMPCDLECESAAEARYLYSKGYRKASDVAREIFEKVRKKLVEYFDVKGLEYATKPLKNRKQLQIESAYYQGVTNAIKFAFNTFKKIENKYTEDEDE